MGTPALEGAAQGNIAGGGKARRQDRLTVLEALAFIVTGEQMTNEEIRIAIAKDRGWRDIDGFPMGRPPERTSDYPQIEIPNYTEDLNAILPLLHLDAWIWREKNGTWCVESHDEAIGMINNQSLALAACEFYLRSKGLWKE